MYEVKEKRIILRREWGHPLQSISVSLSKLLTRKIVMFCPHGGCSQENSITQ
jgi:hypothetical protein